MGSTDGVGERVTTTVLALVFLAISGLAVVDLVGDAGSSTGVVHLVTEGLIATAGLVGSVWMAVRLTQLAARTRSLEHDARELEADLHRSRADAERFRREAHDLIAGLGAAIDHQLDAWNLSPAEKDVAMLLLKGLSHKDIGEVRGVAESTVRQQARAMYRKAGLTGRADLAAFFLEDLLAPRSET